MWGHPNVYIFPLSYALKMHANPNNICAMVIYNHSGPAPTSLDHLKKVMSLHEMSPHEIAKQNMANLN